MSTKIGARFAISILYGSASHPALSDPTIKRSSGTNQFPRWYSFAYYFLLFCRMVSIFIALLFGFLLIDSVVGLQKNLLIQLSVIETQDAFFHSLGIGSFLFLLTMFLVLLVLSLIFADMIARCVLPRNLFNFFVLSDYLRSTGLLVKITPKHWETIDPELLRSRYMPSINKSLAPFIIFFALSAIWFTSSFISVTPSGTIRSSNPGEFAITQIQPSELKRASLSFTTRRDKYDYLIVSPSLLLEFHSGKNLELWNSPFDSSAQELLKALTALKHAGVSISVQTMPASFDEQTDSYFVDIYLFLQNEMK